MTNLDSKFWSRYFEVYDYLNILIPYQNLLNTCINELEIHKNDKTLDVGSGTGNLSVLFEQAGAETVGIDSSYEGICIHKAKQKKSNILLGDLTKPLPFKDGLFDKICSNNVVYTLPEKSRQPLFNELYRVIKPNGIIVVSNIARGFSSSHIYFEHIRLSFKKNGFLNTLIQGIRLVIPTMKILYYNHLIKKADISRTYRFVEENEQRDLLAKAGFINIGQNRRIYSNQAILNKAYK